MVLLMLSGCGHTHEFEDATQSQRYVRFAGEIDVKALIRLAGSNCENPKHIKDVGNRGRHLDILLI